MNAWGLLTPALIVTASALATLGAQGSEPFSGSSDYQVYCSSCHDAEARSDGTIAKSLKRRPSDLTQLKKRNDGVFPSDRVFKTIDGRSGGAHDNSDMPRWGGVLSKASESASPQQTVERIDTLVKYLDTLQAK
jgi:mono/diheme cytochrome c family protein